MVIMALAGFSNVDLSRRKNRDSGNAGNSTKVILINLILVGGRVTKKKKWKVEEGIPVLN